MCVLSKFYVYDSYVLYLVTNLEVHVMDALLLFPLSRRGTSPARARPADGVGSSGEEKESTAGAGARTRAAPRKRRIGSTCLSNGVSRVFGDLFNACC